MVPVVVQMALFLLLHQLQRLDFLENEMGRQRSLRFFLVRNIRVPVSS